jgi:hypothetical protein
LVADESCDFSVVVGVRAAGHETMYDLMRRAADDVHIYQQSLSR